VICWRYADEQQATVPEFRGVLGKFMGLRTAEQVADFARTYGVFRLCRNHRKPWSHNPPVTDPDFEASWGCLEWQGGEGEERVAEWLYYVEQAKAILHMARRLFTGRWSDSLAESPQWSVIAEYPLEPNDAQDARDTIGFAVELWLALGNVRPSLRWTGDAVQFGFDPGRLGLFGVLALQLATEVASARALYVCDNCGKPYARIRRLPKPGQRNFCPECGQKAAALWASRRYRERVRKGRSDGK
jgi:DNA-directed RNA polymerase subunit RPC12/RpoP